MNVVSDAFLAAAVAGDQHIITTVEVWSGPTATNVPAKIADITANVTLVAWAEDETRSPRWTCSVTVESQGVGKDSLVPVATGDLLHPLSGHELRIFHGYQYPDGTQELTPCGVYRMSKPKIVDDGSKVEITVTGNDRSIEVNRRGWTAPYPISTSPTIDVAVHDLINSRMPGLTYNLTPTTLTAPNITFGTQGASSSGGPMADAISMAQSLGMELFFDQVGTVTMRPVPDPTTSPVLLTFIEGATCSVVDADRVLDETQTFNGVQATGTAAGTAVPVTATVWVTDPTSPLLPATFGYVPYYLASPFITTLAQAQAAATAKLQTLLTAYDDAAFTAVPNAALRCGDAIGLQRARIGVSSTYVVSRVSMSSDPTQTMSVTNRARRTA